MSLSTEREVVDTASPEPNFESIKINKSTKVLWPLNLREYNYAVGDLTVETIFSLRICNQMYKET